MDLTATSPGYHRMRIKGDISYNCAITQTITISGKKGDTFTFGGRGQSYAFPNGTDTANPDSNAIFGFMLRFVGESSSAWIYLPFEAYSNEWQYIAGSAKADRTFYKIELRAINKYNTNTAYFDNIFLYATDFATEYEYDSNGKLVSTKGALDQGVKYTYSGPNVTKVEVQKNSSTQETYTYSYTGKNDLQWATSDANVLQSYSYDYEPGDGAGVGNVISTRISDSKDEATRTLSMYVKNSYTTSKNYVAKTTGTRGESTS